MASKRLTEEERKAIETAKAVERLRKQKERAERKTELLLAVAARKIQRAKATLERKLRREQEAADRRARKVENRPYTAFLNAKGRNACIAFSADVLERASKFVVDRETGPDEPAMCIALYGAWDSSKEGYTNDSLFADENKRTFDEKGGQMLFRANIDAKKMERKILIRAGWLMCKLGLPDDVVMQQTALLSEGLKGKWEKDIIPELVELYRKYLKPSVALRPYAYRIWISSPTHMLPVYPDQYDDAFELACVSNADIKYRVRSAWLKTLCAEKAAHEMSASGAS